MKNSHHITLPVAVTAAVLAGVALGFMFGYMHGTRNWFSSRAPENFQECAAAGYPVMESYPRQCRAGGKTFAEVVSGGGGNGGGGSKACVPAGCSGQLCVDADKADGAVTTCEYRAEYACFKAATCERQTTGECGWTQTAALQACLLKPPALE